ncbi:Pc21g06830 [Penicillium rubens Wisconsin 54-1255]|uniref:Pc21g06830 protein n=3 Tax=Penicillium chrysogenum species complex TaxID=254878 RepID=B6HJQ0_PENRW|nr:Pc21g06830 [Penicillium rubens Wisconsin 54-1255]
MPQAPGYALDSYTRLLCTLGLLVLFTRYAVRYVGKLVRSYLFVSPEHITLDYGCSDWRISSQRAADLYSSGTKLWTREDLKAIEQQLGQSYIMDRFSVRRIDGSIILISNPLFQVQNPIWKPYIKYQEYWQLVKTQPSGPIETYLCSYIVDWSNQTARNFRGFIAQPMQVFEEKDLLWQNSTTYKQLAALIQDLIGTNTVKKVLCFGLGDFCRSAPEWLKEQHGSWDETSDIENVTGCIIQHSMAITIAQLCRGNETVPLLAQDPDYTELAEKILTNNGFKIVGPHGAGGFAEIDEESIVISAFAAAPVKQIIADLARPMLIISTGFNVFNSNEKPLADAESPRTRQMWLDYDVYTLPSHSKDVEICCAVKGLHLYRRRQQPLDSQGA